MGTVVASRLCRATPLGLVIALLMGCSSATPTPASVQTAKLAIGEAARFDAAQLASVDYQLAREKLDRAREATEQGDEVMARRLAEEATVDARYAQARAQAEHAQRAAIESESTVDSLQSGGKRL